MSDLVVDVSEAGERVDVLVAHRLGISRSQAAQRIAGGLVLLDGAPCRKQDRVAEGQRLTVREPEAAPPLAPPPLPPVRYRDEHLLVIAKPPGLVVHPGPGHPDGTLVDALRAADVALAAGGGDERPGIVHRLDRDTSGLLVVASTEEAYHGLVDALRGRQVRRRYLALVLGVPDAVRGRVEGPIGRDPRDRQRFAVVAEGKPAVTRYHTLATGALPGEGPGGRVAVALLGCELETGRTHQIRVHLTAMGHPIVGDPTYGRAPAAAAALGLDRPALHATALAFTHPVTGAELAFEEPLPADLEAACERAALIPLRGDLSPDPD